MKLYTQLLFAIALCIVFNQRLFAQPQEECITDASGNTTCAAQIFTPTTLEELQAVVRKAIQDGVLIRPFGGLHSEIDDVAVGPTNYLIDMTMLNKIFEIDLHKQTIRVQGGINLHRLSHELAKAGLELLTQPGPYDATAGGMSANAVHESGLNGCLCDSILEIEIVDGKGNLRRVSKKKHKEWLPAARVSLGVLGPIYSVTFQCYPATKRKVFAADTDLQTILANLQQDLHQNDAFQFLYDPVSQAALFETFNITKKPESNTSNRDYAHYLPNSNVVGELNTIVFPLLPTSAYAAVSQAIVTGSVVNHITEFFYKSYSYFHSNAISRGRIVELAIPAKFIAPALKDLSDLVQTYKNNGIEFISFAEVRYVADKHLMYLSPTQEPSWCVGFLVIFPDNSPDAINILRDFTFMMEAKYNARPEWGNNPEFLTFDQTLAVFGKKNVKAFNAVRRIFDPHGLFYTPYFQQRLGPL